MNQTQARQEYWDQRIKQGNNFKRRSPLEILTDILLALKTKELLYTRLLVKTNITSKPFKRYIKGLLKGNYVYEKINFDKNVTTTTYGITAKGEDALEILLPALSFSKEVLG